MSVHGCLGIQHGEKCDVNTRGNEVVACLTPVCVWTSSLKKQTDKSNNHANTHVSLKKRKIQKGTQMILNSQKKNNYEENLENEKKLSIHFWVLSSKGGGSEQM